ncbi:MAG TPA: hypothetical protein VFE47_14825 [Tepidisphaeraceae bacterium]|jgi:hypothetical protein|nr:hypothetical protein [Tepidisphaeraceae bacterium]
MGIDTQLPQAAHAACGEHRCVRHKLFASVVLASVCVLSSASAKAGLSENSPGIDFPSSPVALQLISPEGGASASVADANLRPVMPVASNDPLAIDPPARDALLTQNSVLCRLPDPTTAAVINATPKTDATPPLLIPLPTAISAGAIGLAALGIFGAAKRFRRRLFA